MGNQDIVKNNFGSKALNYRLSSTHSNSDDLERMINFLKPKHNDIVLDIATGAGHTAIAFAKVNSNVVAIDITKEMLLQAQIASKQASVDNIEFLEADVHNLPFRDNFFDIVACRFAVHHFYNVQKTLKEMCRVLKPEAKFYILDCSVIDGDETEMVINRLEALRDSSHVYSLSKRQWIKLLKDLPLEIKNIDLLKRQYKLPEWFDRMGTNNDNRQKIFELLNNLSENSKSFYQFSQTFIDTYYIEIIAKKL
ncbi:2-heptaprenyl-1,4-naphthoquinone methyltransferase [Desulfurella amilsii]|uniref:2-heptaprenyl-1,4-naphthoquinone methyltransferase n=1 Tax=Desulfurella amilsii TaxID=1562698 RepID=A0A1X4XYU5_9BACT|nr:methyltransferase domain-containing protein [Desulfurella amilsii]OSS42709.1 2-heptaprenyl-1,4-naphthoquinone methyltransferase [Desulfurella amilsii]